MQHTLSRAGSISGENQLLALCGLVAITCVAFVPATPGPILFQIPEVIIPFGISIALGLYTVRMARRRHSSGGPNIQYVWAGALGSGAIGVVWMGLHLYYGLPIDVLPDKILTVLSGGIAAGVFVGQSTGDDRQPDLPTNRARVLAETSWTTRSGATPILEAVVEALADLEGDDPLDVDSIYESIDPDVFPRLRAQDDSQWQLLFYTDDYEIRVSGHGTVTVYAIDSPPEQHSHLPSR